MKPLFTTLNAIRAHSPCGDSWQRSRHEPPPCYTASVKSENKLRRSR